MIIVYQSLESTGKKEDSLGTALMGNSFKHGAQSNVGEIYPLDNNQTLTFQTPVYDLVAKKMTFPSSTIQFATQVESKALSSRYDKERKEPGEGKALLLSFMKGVIDTITKSVMNRTRSRGELPSVRLPDIIVLGEAFTTDLLKDLGVSSVGGYRVVTGMNPTGDSRHRFTVLLREDLNLRDSDIEMFPYTLTSNDNKDEQARCVILRVMGWLMAFVHTPNAICKDSTRVIKYLANNAKNVTTKEKLDLVMGDTNQPTSDFVKSTLKNQLGGEDWVSSVLDDKQELVGFGGHNVFSISGTNSTFKTHFDIACTPHMTAVVRDGKVLGFDEDDSQANPAFVFHGLTDKFTELEGKAYAYSDHNGVIVEVLRQKSVYAQRERKRKEERCSDCRRPLTALDQLAGRHLTCRYAPLALRWNPPDGEDDDGEAPERQFKKRKPEPPPDNGLGNG
ncbi:hypothetical protein K8640_32570 [Myxococcus sp. XM-1-1-1]|jgi:hypothetical protein|uniref:hypothetical protein n=1 Tax=Myxococcus sp. XM-1-1-1 TaxID=2874602 RepID=UPI001CC04C21|nr:hypothetical protein [Myxococcus sp. XM-1-1-1]MBZ4412961.1 hypothetical protein [Myxococcus sp. XM-1-1-1]